MSHGESPLTEPASISSGRRRWLWVALVSVMVLAVWVRVRHLGAPLERDEGEYAYAGALLLDGVPPYREFYNMKLPGIYVAYAAVLGVFGRSIEGIHLGLLCVNAAACLLVGLIARRFFGDAGGVVAIAWFALLSLTRSVQGVFANAEHFLLVPALAGLWFVHPRRERVQPLLAGLCLGAAFVVKQHGVFFVAVGALWLVLGSRARRSAWPGLGHALRFAGGVAVPYLAVCAWMWAAGTFDTFWLWTFEYARAYTQQVDGAQALDALRARTAALWRDAPWLWAASAAGLLALGRHRPRTAALALGALVLAGLAAVSTGLFFRPHYFVLLLPAAALCAAAGFEALRRLQLAPGALAAAGAAIALLALTAWQNREDWFQRTPVELTRATFGYNPFPESVPLAAYLAEQTRPDDRIAVLGSEPQLCFYADRRSASGFAYVYALMEEHPFAAAMQKQLAAEIEASQPALAVFVNVPTSWLARETSHPWLFGWITRFLAGYERIAYLDLSEPGAPLRTGAALPPAAEALPQKPFTISVYRRRS